MAWSTRQTKSVEFKSRRCVSVDLQAGVRVLPATRTIKSAYEKVRNVKGLMSRIAAQGALAAARTNSDGQPGEIASGENSWGRGGGAGAGRRTDKGALMRTMSSSGGLLVRKSTGGVSRCVPSMIDRSTGGRKSVPDVKVPTMEHYMSMPCFGAAGDRASASESPSGDGPGCFGSAKTDAPEASEGRRAGSGSFGAQRNRMVKHESITEVSATVEGEVLAEVEAERSASSRPSGASSLGRSSSTSAAGGSRERLPPIAQEGGSGDDGAVDSPRSPLQRVAEETAEPNPLVSAGTSSMAAVDKVVVPREDRRPADVAGGARGASGEPAVASRGAPGELRGGVGTAALVDAGGALGGDAGIRKGVSCSVHRTSGDL